MADKNIFYGYKENQASTGYGCAILYKKSGDTKYRFLCASETVPFPFGDKETFEFNLLNSEVMGQVEGKSSIEQKSVELLYTRDNAYLFETLKGQVIDFMAVTAQLVGYKFSGTISFRPNDATNDIHRGTYTITPMSADPTPYYSARKDILVPLFFADVIPDEIQKPSSTGNVTLNVGIVGNPTGVTYKYAFIDANNQVGTPTPVTASNNTIEIVNPSEGLYIIYAEPSSSTTHSGCFTTVYITE